MPSRADASGGPDERHAPRLTIGEVLTVLREDFPDVSISKIRYLESEDLVHPQRTPSGYRKFSEVDVANLAGGDEVQIGKFRLVYLTGPRTGEPAAR